MVWGTIAGRKMPTQLNVTAFQTGALHIVDVEAGESLAHVKQQLSAATGVPADALSLSAGADAAPLPDATSVDSLDTGTPLSLSFLMCDCVRAPAPPTTSWSAPQLAPLLSAGSPLAASGLLARALGVPIAVSRGGRFPVGTPPRSAVLVELLLGAVEVARDLALAPAAAAAALSAVHALVAGAAGEARGGAGWPPLPAARATWEAALSAVTAPARGATDAAHVLTHAQGAALNAWAQDCSLLLPHHWDMYRDALIGDGEGPGAREEAVVALVEDPPPPEALPPLAAAREAGGKEEEGKGGE